MRSRSTDRTAWSSTLDAMAVVVHAIVQEPVRQAVREALAEERARAETDDEASRWRELERTPERHPERSSGKGGSSKLKLAALGVGLIGVSYLLKRRGGDVLDDVDRVMPGSDEANEDVTSYDDSETTFGDEEETTSVS